MSAQLVQAARFGAPVLFLIMISMPAPEGLSVAGWRTLAVAVWMALWWTTEAIPVSATALLPMLLFPLIGIADIRATTAPYANPLIFLFMGGFIMAKAMEKWELHRRIALNIAIRVGTKPHQLVGGFMLACAFLSMWISNTATAMMMLPIAASIIGVVALGTSEQTSKHFGTAMMLGIAYAASIGGIGTLIGTPPNAFMAGFFNETYDFTIGFARWMLVGIPIVLILLPICWWVLTHLIHPISEAHTPDQIARSHKRLSDAVAKLGSMSKAEFRVLVIFSMAAIGWMTRPLLTEIPLLSGLNDTSIAIFGGMLMFITASGVPGKDRALLTWDDAQGIPWSALILFGGGLSLAGAFSSTGLSVWIGDGLSLASFVPALIFVLLVTAVVVFLTELTSNTATTAAFLPVVAAVADGIGLTPFALAAPAAMAASCAFMLPVATPPNAIVYGSGVITIPQMIRAGMVMNVIGIFLITAIGYWLVPIVFSMP